VKALREVSFALLDYPLSGNLFPDLLAKEVTFPCGQFDVTIKDPTEKHFRVPTTLGLSPHTLSNSGILTERNGRVFSSETARIALDNVHDTLSFAAGRWVGITFVEASDASRSPAWFRWGTSRMSPASTKDNWHDPRHPEWLAPVCNGMLEVKAVEETWDVIRTALYWYMRSNTRGAGIDSSLILSQCALELLSWFVIVKRTGALSEEGYGQLNNASEKLRLSLALLGISRQIPAGLKKVVAVKEWKDVADAIVQARNYLVHPTQSRSGKRRAKRDYPWYELWTAAQWLLELVILRLIGYSGNYRNRTQLKFDAVERVPWA
jgi:hypothetical protein